jgi:antibiotic biosynthesis monooxygenase (ABM) superfamily enzyme
MCLQAIDQMPKLPWFERRFAPGDLGPIYGPRYTRTVARILVVFMIAVIAFSLTTPPAMSWRPAPYIFLATALLMIWSMAWWFHLGRKSKAEQLGTRGTTS